MLTLIRLAGVLQFLIAAVSVLIPKKLGWDEKLAVLDPLTRSVFWTYAYYIFGINLFMACLCTLRPSLLVDESPLARLLCLFMGMYWGVRVLIQIFSFGKHRPAGKEYVIGEVFFLSLFVSLTLIFGYRLLAGGA